MFAMLQKFPVVLHLYGPQLYGSTDCTNILPQISDIHIGLFMCTTNIFPYYCFSYTDISVPVP